MISDNYVPIHQIGNGVTTMFSASWAMISNTYARVYLEDAATGVQTLLTEGVAANQYQITINSSGFIVTYNTAPTASQYAVIGREVTQDQSTPYTTSQGFQGKVEENSFDKLTAMIQDTSNGLSRAIIAPLGDTANLVLPTATLRANLFAAFDASGNVTVASGASGGVPISGAMTPVVTAATLALARAAMGVPGLSDANTFTALNNFTGGLRINGNNVISRINVQRFNGSGTYTPTAGTAYAIGYNQSGGGGGGNAGGATGAGGGGGAGGFAMVFFTAAQLGASQTVTINSGGAAASAGGSVSFGALVTITGGNPGANGAGTTQVAGGVGGVPTVNTGTAIVVSNGANGYCSAAATGSSFGGRGADSPFGAGGAYQTGAGAGSAASGAGAGGGGAVNGSTSGGTGSNGTIVVVEYISG